MEIVNQSPFAFASIVGKVEFPNDTLSLIVKATLDLAPGEQLTPSKTQLLPTGDEYFDGDEDRQGSCRYESDFAHFKPKTDLMLVGKCHVRGGKAAATSWVKIRVGAKSKSLLVFGDRCWERRWGFIPVSSAPAPFTQMELRYENSYGGPGFKNNPVGKGRRKVTNAAGLGVRPLPNIEDPGAPVRLPAGFGPLGRMWHLRKSKLGTYRKIWQKERWPWLPEDFDWSYYNAAPPGLQLSGYLKGDEELYFENLHPKHPEYHSRLPGLRVRCFLNELDEGGDGSTAFREVPMNLDTLWVDMEAEKLVLVWRGVAKVKSQEYEEVQHAFVASEALAEPPRSRESYETLFKGKLKSLKETVAGEVEPPETVEPPDSVDDEMEKAEAEMRATLLAAGISPEEEPSPPSEETKAAEARILKELGIEDEVEPIPLAREQVKARAARQETFAGEDLSRMDLSELDLRGIDFQRAILAGACLRKVNFSGANLSEANLAGADLSGTTLDRAILKDSDLTGADLNRASLVEATLEGAVFEKAGMESAVLDRVKAKDANFSEANLVKASLRNADLPGADFSKATLNQTVFRGANLKGASAAGATGIQVNMEETNLSEFRGSGGANFSRGSFRGATGSQSIWSKANLQDSDFSFSEMQGADFTSASLQRAVLYAANMKLAKFRKADLREARFVSMNLFQGSLEKANLTRTDFSGSNLFGVEFLESVLRDTTFESANLKMTKLASK